MTSFSTFRVTGSLPNRTRHHTQRKNKFVRCGENENKTTEKQRENDWRQTVASEGSSPLQCDVPAFLYVIGKSVDSHESLSKKEFNLN